MLDQPIPFKRIADAALHAADRLVPEWLPDGQRVQAEWKALNPRRADSRVGSFSINLVNGVWMDFACDDKGGDLISLYAYLFCNDDQGRAARELAQRLGIEVPKGRGKAEPNTTPVAPPAAPDDAGTATPAEGVKEKKRTLWAPVLPVPDDAPPAPAAHEHRGLPALAWHYRDGEGRLLGTVARFETSDGGKEIIPLTYCRHEESGKHMWRWLSFADPRPMYGLDRIAAKPDATVLLTEGEKCADKGHELLQDFACASWPGGGKAVGKVDWSPLAGRKVILWPDADAQREKLTKAEKEAGLVPEDMPLLPPEKQPGIAAMRKIAEQLVPLGCSVWMVDLPPPGELAGGWDIADAVADGWTAEQICTWLRDRAKPYGAPQSAPDPTPAPQGAGGEGEADMWRPFLLRKNGELVACVANVFDILLHHPLWSGVLAWDEHASRVVKLKEPPYAGGAVGEWESLDDSMTAMWLARRERMNVSSSIVAEAIEALAHTNPIHPVRDWLRSRPEWDGTRRVDHWLVRYVGVKLREPKAGDELSKADQAYNAYIKRVSRWFLLGMIARVMKPGCKFDYCLVLEGSQGKGKSTTLSILGGDWYGDTDLDLHNKDSMSALRGKWLYEFSEMGSVTRAESSKQKSFLSRQVDEYRPVYGRREIKSPRQLVFAGSVNEWEWNKDPTGGRRFWPVICEGVIDTAGLREVRDQLFAEALAMYEQGLRYWPTPDEQRTMFDPEQLARELSDSLVDALHDWVYKQVALFSKADAMFDCLKLDPSKITRDMDTRVGIALRKLGCQRVEKRNGMIRYWYKPPAQERPATSNTDAPDAPAQPNQGGAFPPPHLYGGDDVGF